MNTKEQQRGPRVPPTIAKVVDWGFRGWDEVRSYYDQDGDCLRVGLTLDMRYFEAQPPDINELGEQLFQGTDAWKLVEMARKQRSRLGLRRYGRRR